MKIPSLKALDFLNAETPVELSAGGDVLYFVDMVTAKVLTLLVSEACAVDGTAEGDNDTLYARRPFPPQEECGEVDLSSMEAAIEAAGVENTAWIEHDVGYMNNAIPYDYGMDESVACKDPATGRTNLNLDALLMTGHTCHRCLPEPCSNGGVCTGFRNVTNEGVRLPNPNAPEGVSYGFTCECPEGTAGDIRG